ARLHAEEAFASNSHDREIVSPDLNVAAQHCGIALETSPPIVVADHQVRVSPGNTILGGSENPAEGGRDMENVEGVSGDVLANGLLHGGVLVRNLDIGEVARAEKSEARGITGSGAVLLIDGITPGPVFERTLLPRLLNLERGECEEALRFHHRQRSQ